MTAPTTRVIIPAAGSGTRLGLDQPKAFVDLGGSTILEHCVQGVRDWSVDVEIVVVVPADLVERATALVPSATVVAGGAHRSESVRAGLAISGDADIVLVHDAARPLTPPAVFRRVRDAIVTGHRAVVPGLPVADTLKRVNNAGRVLDTVDREPLRAIQTPQGFTREALTAAHADDAGLATDDAGLVERIGIDVHVVDGDPLAFKITTPWDLRVARDIVAERVRASNARPETTSHEGILSQGARS